MKQKNNGDNPELLVLWLTNDCNLKCKYCYADTGSQKEYMTFDIAKRAIDKMGKDGFKLQLAGGEPLLNVELLSRIHDYITENGIRASLQLQTNGTLISPELAKEIKRMGIAVGVSLDGGVEANEAARGQTGRALEGIKNLAEQGIMINLNCVLTKDNAENLPQLVDMALYLGNVNGIGIDLLRITGRAVHSNIHQASPDQISSALLATYERTLFFKNTLDKRIIIREIEDAKKRLASGAACNGYCYASFGKSMVVLPDGSAYPCGSLAGTCEYRMGNVKDDVLRRIALNVRGSGNCSGCRYETLCPGACPSRQIINYGENGFSAQDCALRRTAFEIAEKKCVTCI